MPTLHFLLGGKNDVNAFNAYRMDNRTEEEFARDIAIGTATESDIIQRYAHYVKRVYGIDIVITDNGCDNSGQYLEQGQVSTAADYLINGKPAEIKFNNSTLTMFRIKASQVESYYKQGATVIWVNGYMSGCPRFALIPPAKLLEIMDTKGKEPFDGWGGKLCYVLDTTEFLWFKLDKLEDEIDGRAM